MELLWHGLQCVEIASKTPERELSLVLDPFSSETGLRLPRSLSPAFVAVSHTGPEADISEVSSAKPFVVNRPGEYEVGGVFVHALYAPTTKDPHHLVFLVEVEDVRLVHLGALDQALGEEVIEAFGNVDVLILPVGGQGVLSPAVASETIARFEPRLVIPVGYADQDGKSKIARGSLEAFLKELGPCRREDGSKAKIRKSDLPEEDMLLFVLARA